MSGLRIAFFASSLVSAYWNGAATYYRGIVRALARHGHQVTFFEPDAYDRQAHRDIPDPPWAKVVVYDSAGTAGVRAALRRAAGADVVVKASGVGVFDDLLEEAVLDVAAGRSLAVFWDVDAPATLHRLRTDATYGLRRLLPAYDLILTYGGGPPVMAAYRELGARRCIPIYNALDPDVHHPVEPEVRFAADASLLANRMPDREERIEEFFFRPASLLPDRSFLLGGSGWGDRVMPPNVRWIGHVFTSDHNAVNSSALAVINVNRESMAVSGFSPPTRIFEAAGAGACLISDRWPGMDTFLEPDQEVLLAGDGRELALLLGQLSRERSRAIGNSARARVLAEHTYEDRVQQVIDALTATQPTTAPGGGC